jgi:hypothetical protein
MISTTDVHYKSKLEIKIRTTVIESYCSDWGKTKQFSDYNDVSTYWFADDLSKISDAWKERKKIEFVYFSMSNLHFLCLSLTYGRT